MHAGRVGDRTRKRAYDAIGAPNGGRGRRVAVKGGTGTREGARPTSCHVPASGPYRRPCAHRVAAACGVPWADAGRSGHRQRPAVGKRPAAPGCAERRAVACGLFANEPIRPGIRALEVGAGSGALALAAACGGADAWAVDVSRRAVLTTRVNAWRARLPLTIRRGDLFTPVCDHAYRLILANPLHVPAPLAHGAPRGRFRAWDAGSDGRLILERICLQRRGRRASWPLHTAGPVLRAVLDSPDSAGPC
ncbi:methyltransferase [Streptomyces sp. NPDC004008]